MYRFRHLVLLFTVLIITAFFAGTVKSQATNAVSGTTKKAKRSRAPQFRNDTIVVRFEYKQSALFHKYTLETLDSIIDILLRDTAITLAIDGYAYKDEGSDTICYFLSLNRALFIQTYILGRGVELTRISNIKAWGRTRQQYKNKDANGLWVNCRAELRLVYPIPPKKMAFFDRDEDGIEDGEDDCPDVFGLIENDGCPDSAGIIIPFAIQESALTPVTYAALDSVVAVLKENPTFAVSIGGHSNLAEGAYSVCQRLAADRAEITKLYLISRQIHRSRIVTVMSYGISKPVNPAKTPRQILDNARAEIRIINK